MEIIYFYFFQASFPFVLIKIMATPLACIIIEYFIRTIMA